MRDRLIKIISHYGITKQLKHFQSEVFELNEAIIKKEYADNCGEWEDKNHITEEIADCFVMLEQFRLYYDISDLDVKDIMNNKIDRQLERISKEVE